MGPNLEEDGWELESAAARYEKYPDTFDVPDEEERESLRAGDGVKLLFLLSGNRVQQTAGRLSAFSTFVGEEPRWTRRGSKFSQVWPPSFVSQTTPA